jgi:nitrogen fixation protein
MFKVTLRSTNEPVEVMVPKKPIEEDNKLVVYEFRKDGTLNKVWRFEKMNIISITEVTK